ncbi:hypothetical protein [Roseibium sp.]|uniref:hypothetical protein n=1 Tax=Roseibium sp. TaxID=1936156 RepID=UPI003D0D69BF
MRTTVSRQESFPAGVFGQGVRQVGVARILRAVFEVSFGGYRERGHTVPHFLGSVT